MLEIGGVGEIQLDLLRLGAAWATNLELSPSYEADAEALIEEAGFTGRVSRRLVDITDDPSAVEPADIVAARHLRRPAPESCAPGPSGALTTDTANLRSFARGAGQQPIALVFHDSDQEVTLLNRFSAVPEAPQPLTRARRRPCPSR